MDMFFESKEDKVFYIASGLIGSISKYYGDIVNTYNSGVVLPTLVQAALVAFISGFLGLAGKKLAEEIYNYIKKKFSK